jgi:dihydrofolate reductase
MRRVIYGAACSLDGFIAAENGGIDWLHFSRDVQEYMASFWPRIDTIVMGRKTFQVASAASPKPRKPSTRARANSKAKNAGPLSYVFSRTLSPAEYPDVNIVATDAGDFLRHLKAQPGKDICIMGGGELAQSLLLADVVDEVGLNVHPVLLGRGVPFFRDAGRIGLSLVESRVIDGGCILSTYNVIHAAA